MSQTSYNTDQPVAFVGMKGDAIFDRVETGLVEDAAGINFGVFVKPGTNPATQVAIITAATAVQGITLHRHVEKALGTGLALYSQNMAADISRQGKVWMYEAAAGGTLSVGDPVYAMIDTAAQAGQATDADGAANILVPTAMVRDESTDPDGVKIVLVEINLPS